MRLGTGESPVAPGPGPDRGPDRARAAAARKRPAPAAGRTAGGRVRVRGVSTGGPSDDARGRADPDAAPRPVRRRLLSWHSLDLVFFGIALVHVTLLALALARQGWRPAPQLAYLLGFWLLTSYLALPRVHRILTAIYVPDYFIGRARTTNGMLGDPINLAVRGTGEDLHRVMQAAGWTLADPLSLGSSMRIVGAALTRRSYRAAPVSTLMLFGRPQAFAYEQEVAGSPSRRHHIRFWPTPGGWLLPGGARVDWLAAGTYDRAVGLSLFTGQVTHKIDADTDAERDHVLATVRDAVPAVSATVLERFSTGYHSRNGGGDAVRTDGNLPILELDGADLSAAPAPVLPDGDAGAPAPGDDIVTATSKAARRAASRPTALVCAMLAIVCGIVLDALSYLPHVSQLVDLMVAELGHPLPAGRFDAVVWGSLAVIYLGLGALIALTFRGHDRARFALLGLLCLQLTGQLWQWAALPAGSLSLPELATTSMYVLGIYGLSSLAVAQWCQERRRRRRTRRAGR